MTESRELKPGGAQIPVTEENKREYVKLVCQMKMTGAIRKQLNSFLDGFYDIIPKRLISIFNEQELELLISGLPTIDIDDLKANTEYHKYQSTSLQVRQAAGFMITSGVLIWLWEVSDGRLWERNSVAVQFTHCTMQPVTAAGTVSRLNLVTTRQSDVPNGSMGADAATGQTAVTDRV